MTVRCFKCQSEMVNDGESLLDQCDGPTLRARKYVCPKCPEPVVALVAEKPNPIAYGQPVPIVYGKTRVEGDVTYSKEATA